MPAEEKETTSSRLPADKLESSRDYPVWKTLLANYFRVRPKMDEIYAGDVKFETTTETNKLVVYKDGTELFGAERRAYVNAEIEMNSLVLRCLCRNFASQLFEYERFETLWKGVERLCVGEIETKLWEITNKLQTMRYTTSLNQLLEHFDSLKASYMTLGGTMSEAELCRHLLNAAEGKYSHVPGLVRYNFSQRNEQITRRIQNEVRNVHMSKATLEIRDQIMYEDEDHHLQKRIRESCRAIYAKNSVTGQMNAPTVVARKRPRLLRTSIATKTRSHRKKLT